MYPNILFIGDKQIIIGCLACYMRLANVQFNYEYDLSMVVIHIIDIVLTCFFLDLEILSQLPLIIYCEACC